MHLCIIFLDSAFLWEPLKTGVKSKNGQGVPDSGKTDEVRLYALRGGLKKQAVCYTHFHSNKVFRGDLMYYHSFFNFSTEKIHHR
jgi:hypothetical protein